MKVIAIDTWNRKEHYEFFNTFSDPYFAVTSKVDVTVAKQYAKKNELSFFGVYLHACMQAINSVENFKYRIEDDKVVRYDVIHASATMIRPNQTFGFTFVNYNEDLNSFIKNVQLEKERILNSNTLFPPTNTLDCIYCSAMPWVDFTGHKEPVSGQKESVPKLAFGKVTEVNDKLEMSVAVSVNHALVDGYHVGQFLENFQEFLNSYK
ncbi:chloramphenicol acetyltransferase [Cellulophaga baltica]|uniref:chloramphenicol acetyltransferase n=1 Tax=Cellulophaga TaxID=104264 RepID=UPI001C07C62C|nr:MULTISPECIES: chloramphenicol acetyltransferase [Cellulophaga]MBU2994843.1 chloramphenicol acetyltransferase [Cellulophaga baltica]MDO6766238.1 chloramphenicol acetyltransferase [Cellulophaga sp. 1_MG-2023]